MSRALPSGARPCLLALAMLLSAAPALAQTGLTEHRTKYYRLYTDLDENGVREATLRITLMAEEYFRRTSDFARNVNQIQPFHLYSRYNDYLAAGGLPNTAGVFNGEKLMAVVLKNRMTDTWSTVQHEGFHQFVHHTVGRGLPIWANEGLAEYFGYGVWTGDNFYVGLIPPLELEIIRGCLAKQRFKPLRDMMLLPHEIWNDHVARNPNEGALNYLQAWSMIHFLGHADEGKYQKAFGKFLGQVSGGADWEAAWVRHFGRNVADFQEAWEKYWRNLPDDPTGDQYAGATLASLTSFYARAFSQRQLFENADEFLAAADRRELRAHKEDWLPESLLATALKDLPKRGTLRVERKPGTWLLVLETPGGATLEGRFRVKNQRVDDVDITTRRGKKEPRR